MKRKLKKRHLVLGILLILVAAGQLNASLAEGYAHTVYPRISYLLSAFSNVFPFAIGDLFIFLSIVGVVCFPFFSHFRLHWSWKKAGLCSGEYLLWVYVWFYLAWGLNYSQPDFYQRTHIPHTAYTPENFNSFIYEYITKLNQSFVPYHQMTWKTVKEEDVRQEVTRIYKELSDSLGVHKPPHDRPQAKRMIFTPLCSKVGVTGSMGPFFCEFTLNGDLHPLNYPSVYAHELSHLLGITNEAEANFYAYQVCTRSQIKEIRYAGYFAVLGHVMRNAQMLLPREEYERLYMQIRSDICVAAQLNQDYWREKYSPALGTMQNWLYDLYLKGNKIESGWKNYSEVVGLLISYHEWEKGKKNQS